MSKTLRANKKEILEQKATELFQERGYAATSMRDLATHMGMEAASLYSHIRSKEELLQNICFRLAQRFFEALDRLDGKGLSPTEKLKAAIRAHVGVLTEDVKASAVFLNEWRHMSEPYLSDFLQLREEYEQRFRAIIDSGKAAGDFRQMDGKFAVLTVFSALNWLHNWYRPEGKLTPEEISDQLSELIINGIKDK